MSFPFFHNRIVNAASQQDPEAWNKWVNSVLKEASEEAKPGTGICGDEKDPRGQERGQVINTEGEEAMTNDPQMPKDQGGNARPDKGGKTDQSDNKQSDKEGTTRAKPKVAGKCDKCGCESDKCECKEDVKEASCGKEMGESNDAGKVTEKHTEAGPGNDENTEPKVLINNDPNYQKGESTGKGKKKDKSSSSHRQMKKASVMNRQEKIALIAQLGANPNNPVQWIEAMTGIKIANLTSTEKDALKKFWLTMYDEDYVDDMLTDR